MIRLFDSARGEVVDVETREPGHLSMYVCGPTVYDVPHVGHGRFTLVWDVARRWYSYLGYDVRYVSNVTDVDDKIIARAAAESRTESDVAAEFEARWFESMDTLGVARPDESPRATEYIVDMVELISDLVLRGVAYQTSDGVYFDVAQIDDYGLLAGQP
ncbi:MAG: cysteine--tRNA ligase, partial [Acidimicrobiales bacterium]